jgi:hypothetical protein
MCRECATGSASACKRTEDLHWQSQWHTRSTVHKTTKEYDPSMMTHYESIREAFDVRLP